MECLTSPDALTRCPKRVRLDFDSHSGLPPWANGYEGNGDDHGNSIGWGSQVFGLPAEPLTPAASPDSTFDLAESTNPSILPHQAVRSTSTSCIVASSPRRLDDCSQSKAFIDCVKSNRALLPSHQASPCVPIHEPLTDFDYNHGNPNQLLELQSLTRSLGKPHRLI
ncbi:hypothetical protein CDV36_016539 [Fusarium kuroshium]|uniref:Uncharacterized protein n=1 Tax=Fusarium kuroshium TaxID=2010991 RepID=A0A3M2QM08_9HYPO|nr:hypothetical protein CDV36_016539 [Fusarium kuroshium]